MNPTKTKIYFADVFGIISQPESVQVSGAASKVEPLGLKVGSQVDEATCCLDQNYAGHDHAVRLIIDK